MPRVFLLSLIAFASACGGSPTGPQSGLIGRYELTLLDSDIRGVITDHLAAGARISIDVRSNRTALVELFVPAGRTDGMDLRETIETGWSTQRQALTPTIIVTTLWIDASSAIISSGWRVEGQTLHTNPPSCSMEHWEPSILECRINVELSKVIE